MKQQPNPAFILHRRNYRETSLLLDVFSREYGRISLLAKGAKQRKSGWSELLQPYQPLLVNWSGQSELKTLISLEAGRPAYNLQQRCLMAGFYLNELIVRLLHPHEAHTDLFDDYEEALRTLANSGNPIEGAIRIFEKNLLNSLGYGLVLDHDVLTRQSIQADAYYDYQHDRGPSIIIQEMPGQNRISGQTLLALESGQFNSGETLREAKYLMRSILRNYLGNKPLLSRSLYKSYINNSLTGMA